MGMACEKVFILFIPKSCSELLLFGLQGFICRNLKNEVSDQLCGSVGKFNLYDEVLRCDPVAFEYIAPGKMFHWACQFFVCVCLSCLNFVHFLLTLEVLSF